MPDVPTIALDAAVLRTLHKAERAFADWMHRVDRAIQAKTGLTSRDLPAQCYRDMFDDGMSPSRTAIRLGLIFFILLI